MHQNFGTIIKEIENLQNLDKKISHKNHEIIVTNVFAGTFQYNNTAKNLIIIDYIHSNISENNEINTYEIEAFINDFKLKIEDFGDFYNENLHPGKKAKNKITFRTEEFGKLEIYITLENISLDREKIIAKLTIHLDDI